MGITDKCPVNKTKINKNIALKHYPCLEQYPKCSNSSALNETLYWTLSHYVEKGFGASKSEDLTQ